ncbi:hypothetical protein GGD81_002909 [Rhodobium orientis]|uniref:hypothetical protein n=1 Tax=Rhodobium orientis TaxID=34017 RepID=UPI000DADC3AD|nr:hypothetical protein [Rhodobium orientis]MBB4303857.1 hypothetical protein [Rhodobium orientis]
MKRKHLKWNFLISIILGVIAVLDAVFGREIPMQKAIFYISVYFSFFFLIFLTITPVFMTLAYNIFKFGEPERKAMERPPVSWFLLRDDE